LVGHGILADAEDAFDAGPRLEDDLSVGGHLVVKEVNHAGVGAGDEVGPLGDVGDGEVAGLVGAGGDGVLRMAFAVGVDVAADGADEDFGLGWGAVGIDDGAGEFDAGGSAGGGGSRALVGALAWSGGGGIDDDDLSRRTGLENDQGGGGGENGDDDADAEDASMGLRECHVVLLPLSPREWTRKMGVSSSKSVTLRGGFGKHRALADKPPVAQESRRGRGVGVGREVKKKKGRGFASPPGVFEIKNLSVGR
jgi:hypothetical protein